MPYLSSETSTMAVCAADVRNSKKRPTIHESMILFGITVWGIRLRIVLWHPEKQSNICELSLMQVNCVCGVWGGRGARLSFLTKINCLWSNRLYSSSVLLTTERSLSIYLLRSNMQRATLIALQAAKSYDNIKLRGFGNLSGDFGASKVYVNSVRFCVYSVFSVYCVFSVSTVSPWLCLVVLSLYSRLKCTYCKSLWIKASAKWHVM